MLQEIHSEWHGFDPRRGAVRTPIPSDEKGWLDMNQQRKYYTRMGPRCKKECTFLDVHRCGVFPEDSEVQHSEETNINLPESSDNGC